MADKIVAETKLETADEEAPAEESALQLWSDRRWCALHTRARHEKKVVACCEGIRIPYYLPLRESHTFSGGKRNTFMLPLFPGYIFAALGPGDLSSLKQTNSVAQKLAAPDEVELVQSLVDIRRALATRGKIELTTFKPGRRVRVIGGPLAGVVARVIRHKNRRRLQLRVEAINQAIVFDVPQEHLELFGE